MALYVPQRAVHSLDKNLLMIPEQKVSNWLPWDPNLHPVLYGEEKVGMKLCLAFQAWPQTALPGETLGCSVGPARQGCSARPMARAEDTSSSFWLASLLLSLPHPPIFLLLSEVLLKFSFRIVQLCCYVWEDFTSTAELFLILFLVKLWLLFLYIIYYSCFLCMILPVLSPAVAGNE